jgi:hypothetical protein
MGSSEAADRKYYGARINRQTARRARQGRTAVRTASESIAITCVGRLVDASQMRSGRPGVVECRSSLVLAVRHAVDLASSSRDPLIKAGREFLATMKPMESGVYTADTGLLIHLAVLWTSAYARERRTND